MTRVALKGILGRRLRTALTAFAVVLGVAMVSGAYIVTDTMLGAADDLSAASYDGVDAVVSAKRAFDVNENEGFSETRPIPEALVEEIRGVDEVEVAAAEIGDQAKLIGRDGKPLGGEGAPAFAVGFDAQEPGATGLSPFVADQGRFPTGPGEVAIDANAAEDEGYKLGDKIGLAARGPVRQLEIVGIATFGDVQSIGNASLAIVDLQEGQELFKKPDQVDSVLIAARRGVGIDELEKAVGEVLPAEAQVESAQSQDRFQLGGLKEFLDIIQIVLVAFGGVALFVGAFIIFNTLSITVAQRSREFALLRTIGASRRQVLASVLLEALVIGLIASVVGLIVGLGLAQGLNAIFRAIGLELPQSGTVVDTRTIIVSFVVGVGVTMLAGLAPALRATRVDPVTALREGVAPPARRSRFAPYAAVITTVLGVALVVYGVFADGLDLADSLLTLAAGCVILFIGVALVSPRLVRPMASVLGRPAQRIAGFAGGLARQNSMRNPGRTAITAAALMIGLALVTFVAVLGEGLRNSFGDGLEQQLASDFVVTADDGFSPFAPEAAEAVDAAPEAQLVTGVSEDQVQVLGDTTTIGRVDPAKIAGAYQFDFVAGSEDDLATIDSGGAVITEDFADDNGLTRGEKFEALSPGGEKLDLTVSAVDSRPALNPLGLPKIFVGPRAFDAAFPSHRNRYVFIDAEGGDSVRPALEKALAGFPDAKLQTKQELREDGEKDLNQFLGLLYVLLALSVIVSLFGIVNTLVLAVFERTRELGMLRAVGMTRRQVRRLVRHESIIVALIGTVLGMAVGLFLAALVTQALSDEGISFTVPVGTLVAFVVVAVVSGMLAAILPARRASRLNVLDALQYE